MRWTIEAVDQANSRAAINAPLAVEGDLPGDAAASTEEASRLSSLDDCVLSVVAALRQHGHLSNVLTHISDRSWSKVEEAFRSILDTNADRQSLSPLAQNIIELLCADRGVTGRMMKPYFRSLLDAILEPAIAARLARHMTVLFLELQCGLRHAIHAPPTVNAAPPMGDPN